MSKNNKKVGLILLGVIVFMIALTAVSVPLYRLFCQKTGYNGTVQKGGVAPKQISQREITILFDARVDPGLPWEFKPETRKMKVHIGEQALVSFIGTNLSASETTGTAIYNVNPDKIGEYFHKTQCFCFDRQTLGPGKSAHFPVMFYIDPAILKDSLINDVTDITLSYTFYPADSKILDKAIEKFGTKAKQ